MITITLNQILAQNPCADGWARILHARGKIAEQQMQEAVDGGCVPKSYNKLADDEAFPLSLALESNGFDDVLWSLRCLPEDHRLWRKYAVWCARQVQHLMTDPRSINALDVADRHADGMATDDELAAAREAAWAAAWEAAGDAAGSAAGAAAWEAAGDAAGSAARDAAWAAAWEAAGDAAGSAAGAAAWEAAGDAAGSAAREAAWAAAWEATWEATWDAQKAKLLQILEAGHWVD